MKEYFFGIKDNVLIVMGDYEEYLEKVRLGIAGPESLGQQIEYEELNQCFYNDLRFKDVEEKIMLEILEKQKESILKLLSFIQCKSKVPIEANCAKLFLGEKANLILDSSKINVLEEVNFLEIKTFKGKIEGVFDQVKRLILFQDSKMLNVNTIISHFPNIEYLFVNSTIVVCLDLSKCSKLNKIELHNSRNLQEIKFYGDKKPKDFLETGCKKLVV